MPRPRLRPIGVPRHPYPHHWRDPAHAGCVVCSPQVSRRAVSVVRGLQEVAAASLRPSRASTGQSAQNEDETAREPSLTVSTTPSAATDRSGSDDESATS